LKTVKKEKKINELIKHYKQMMEMHDKFYDLTFSAPDAPMFEAAYKMLDSYIGATAKIVGDKGEWLNWYIFENDCGSSSNEATSDGNKYTEQPIDSVQKLVQLIEGKI